MTLERLGEIEKLDRTIKSLKERRVLILTRATSCSSGGWERVHSQNADGSEEHASALRTMPKSSVRSDKVAEAACELAEVDRALRKVRRRRSRLYTYIRSIKDDYVRESLSMKFIDKYTWAKIARIQGMSSGESVRKYCERFLSCKQ